MNALKIFTAFLLIFTSHREVTDAECDVARYNKNGACVRCETCGIGQQVTPNCGRNGQGQLVGPKCEWCPEDSYQDKQAALECTPCTTDCPTGEVVIRKCNATSNMLCGCPAGSYKDEGQCKKCVYCCDDKYHLSSWYEKKCAADGMGRCSCRSHKACSSKPDACVKSNATNSSTAAPAQVSPTKSPRTTTVNGLTLATEATGSATRATEGSIAATAEVDRLRLSPWWIFAPTVCFVVLVVAVLFVTLVWRRNKRARSGQESSESDNLFPRETVQRQGRYEFPRERPIWNTAKLRSPPAEGFSEASDPAIVCSCSLESELSADRLNNKGDCPWEGKDLGAHVAGSLVQKTAATKEPIARHGTAGAVEKGADTGEPEKRNGGSPISDTMSPPQESDMALPGPRCACQQLVYDTQQEEFEKYRLGIPEGYSKKGRADGKPACPIRPRPNRIGHSCSECEPQAGDILWDILARNCLMQQVCVQLNENNQWKLILTYVRKEEIIESLEGVKDPAQSTLKKLRSETPSLTLGEFQSILEKIKRPDLKQLIAEHHMKCDLCKKNAFDDTLRCQS